MSINCSATTLMLITLCYDQSSNVLFVVLYSTIVVLQSTLCSMKQLLYTFVCFIQNSCDNWSRNHRTRWNNSANNRARWVPIMHRRLFNGFSTHRESLTSSVSKSCLFQNQTLIVFVFQYLLRFRNYANCCYYPGNNRVWRKHYSRWFTIPMRNTLIK